MAACERNNPVARRWRAAVVVCWLALVGGCSLGPPTSDVDADLAFLASLPPLDESRPEAVQPKTPSGDGLRQPDSIRRLHYPESESHPVAPAAFLDEIEIGAVIGEPSSGVAPRADAHRAASAALSKAADLDADRRMTVEDLLLYALDHHPLLRARTHEIGVAESRLITAGLLPNPELTLDTDAPVHRGRTADMRLRVMFTLPTAGKRWKREAVAGAEIARARCALSRETESVLIEAADAAVEVLYLQELAELQGELSKLAAQRAEVERSRFDAGTSTFADKTESEVDATQTELRRRDTLSQLAAARMRLARAVGLNPPQRIEVAGRLEFEPVGDVPLETLLAAARETRPETAEARAALLESRRAVALAMAEGVPDLAIGPRYGDAFGDGRNELGARVDLEIPVFDRNQGAISEAAAQTRVRQALAAETELRTLNDVAAVHAELLTLQASLHYYETDVLPIAEQTQSVIREDDPARALSANQVSSLLRSFIQMRVNHLELRYRYNRLRTQLELFLGGTLTDLGVPAGAADRPEPLSGPHEVIELPLPPPEPPRRGGEQPRGVEPEPATKPRAWSGETPWDVFDDPDPPF